MKRFFSIFAIGFFLISADRSFSAVNNFLRAEITDNTGTTISGEVEYKGWLKTPTSIFFREVGKTGKMYLPKDIRSFTVFHENGSREIYSTYTVAIDFASLDLKKLDSKPEPDLVEKTVFLRHLVNGKLNLYGLVDETDKRHYFVVKGEGVPKELTYRKYYYNIEGPDLPTNDLKTSTGVSQVKINSAYRNELYNLMRDNTTIKQEVFEKLEFKERDLVDLVDLYNEGSTYVRNYEKPVMSWEVKAGISAITLNSGSLGSATRIKPSFAIGLNVTIPRTKWSIQNNLRYAGYVNEVRRELGTDNYEITTHNFTYLKIQNMFRYSYMLDQTELFFQGGFLNGYLIKEDISTKRYFYGSESEIVNNSNTKKFERGLLMGIGVGKRKIYAEVDYEISNGYRNSIFDPTFKNLYVTLGYRF